MKTYKTGGHNIIPTSHRQQATGNRQQATGNRQQANFTLLGAIVSTIQ